jgi:hypothetical protein
MTDKLPTPADHIIAFLTGATVCVGATWLGGVALLSVLSRKMPRKPFNPGRGPS